MARCVLIILIMNMQDKKSNDDSLIFCGTCSKDNYIAGFVFNSDSDRVSSNSGRKWKMRK